MKQGIVLIFSVITIIFSCKKSFAQGEILYSGYIFNGLSINPAYAGSQECLNLNFWAKKQWVGMEGAPSSMMLSAHTPVKNEKIALGLTAFNDSWGINNNTGLSGIYAYRINITDKIKISSGLSIGLINQRINYRTLTTKDENDQVLTDNISLFTPDFSAGVFINTDKVYVGISALHLQSNFKLTNESSIFSPYLRKQFFATAGYVFTINQGLKLKPNVLLRIYSSAPLQADLNCTAHIRDVLWLGVSYRTTNDWSFLAQIIISPPLHIGYAIDLNKNFSNSTSYNSHEIMVNYKFSFKKVGLITPRYF